MAGALCSKCGGLLDPATYKDSGLEVHFGCEEQRVGEPVSLPVAFGNPGGVDPFTRQLRDDLVGVIRWYDAQSSRSQQQDIGPSEIGSECDRFLAYRLLNWPEVNTMTDPWPAIVGTAIHLWLEAAFMRFRETSGVDRWDTETTVHPDPFIRGHMDLFDNWLFTVIDWKTLGVTKMRAWQKNGPTEKQKDQVNLYAKGKVEAGARVEKVCLVGLPRAGWLEDIEVWVDDYSPERAQAALDRLYGVGKTTLDLDIVSNPERFNLIEATPDMCSFCPFFQPKNRDSSAIADASGCPGR
jgi:hypothetical protein